MDENRGIAIVTGGGSGIGRAVAQALAQGGWRVVISGRRAETLAATAAAIAGIDIEVADVADPQAVDGLFDQVVARHGRVDLLFNNAGINVPLVPFDQLDVSDLRAIIDTNLWGAMLCARAAMRVMKAQAPQGGRIINNGSISAQAPRPDSAPYTATKHAITGLTKSIILDGRPFNITAGQIDIGNAVSEMSAYMAVGAKQADGTVRPEPRIGVDKVGEAVLHMANLPLDTNVSFMTLMASAMPHYGRG